MALYPPIVASSMPAFDVQRGEVKIYFTLSNYNKNKISDIKNVHVSVRYQSSNVSALKGYEIAIKTIDEQTAIDQALNRYSITLRSSDLDNGFIANTVYKVQLRLSSQGYTKNSNQSVISYLTKNLDAFSEWSTVCIIKPILAPIFYISDFHTDQDDDANLIENEQAGFGNTFFYNLAEFVGIYKTDNRSPEVLKSWRVRLLEDSYTEEDILNINNYVLADSGEVLVNANNYILDNNSMVLECSLPYELTDLKNYKLYFEILTTNGYTDGILYLFQYQQQVVGALAGNLTVYTNEEQGYVKLDYVSSQHDMANIVIRRSDSTGNFLNWKDLKNFFVIDNHNFSYYDFTVQSGILYRYAIQKRDGRGRRGALKYDQTYYEKVGTLIQWQHPFLLEATGNGNLNGVKQLKLKYDFQISSYKTNISESKTDTIGSKYPFIRRNGNMYYRSFPITGTITQYMDEASLFTNEDEMFNGYYHHYQDYQGEQVNYSSKKYNYTYERKFRQKVEQFLYNSKPKLYKSTQEGNILIKLMQISLTPKNELGRLIYNFSATAYQIDEVSIENLDKYGLIQIGTYNPNIYNQVVTIGQTLGTLNQTIGQYEFQAGQDVIGTVLPVAANSIANKIHYNQSIYGTIVTDFKINWLRLTIDSDPYLIAETETEDGTVFVPLETSPSGNIETLLYQMQSTYGDQSVYLGHLFLINGRQIIISYPNNIYEIKDEQFSLNSHAGLIPAKKTIMTVDFRVVSRQEDDLSLLAKNIRIRRTNGQLYGTYSESDQIINQVRAKYAYTYYQNNAKIKRYLHGVNSILVDTQPRTVIKVSTTANNVVYTFIVNETGQLRFDPENTGVSVSSLRIIGRNVPLIDLRDRGAVSDINTIVDPLQKDYCIMNGQYYCYYNSNWRTAELNSMDNGASLIIHCPVDALIFYYAAIRSDYY